MKLLCLVMMFWVALAGCGAPAEPPSPGATTVSAIEPAVAQGPPIRVAVVADLSGSRSALAVPRVAVEDLGQFLALAEARGGEVILSGVAADSDIPTRRVIFAEPLRAASAVATPGGASAFARRRARAEATRRDAANEATYNADQEVRRARRAAFEAEARALLLVDGEPRSDVIAALARVTLALREPFGDPADPPPPCGLLIVSDLEDNVGRRIPLDFPDNCSVAVVGRLGTRAPTEQAIFFDSIAAAVAHVVQTLGGTS